MKIFFKYESKGDLVLKGYIFKTYFEFQSYYMHSTIHFPDKNLFFILKQSELPHFCSFMSIRQAKKLIIKGYMYYLLSKLFKNDTTDTSN